jgi:hypothetical protein
LYLSWNSVGKNISQIFAIRRLRVSRHFLEWIWNISFQIKIACGLAVRFLCKNKTT